MTGKTRIGAIFARDRVGGIGFNNDLPWPRNDEDMKRFKRHTDGCVVVMGRKTWESLGSKCLPNRINVVLSNGTVEGTPHMCISLPSMDMVIEAVRAAAPDKDIWFLGGANLLEQVLPYCERVCETLFLKTYQADTFIDPDWRNKGGFFLREQWRHYKLLNDNNKSEYVRFENEHICFFNTWEKNHETIS